MTGIPADLLPPAVRRQLGLTETGRSRPKPSRAGTSEHQHCPGHCACSFPADNFAAWEAHAKRTGCTRWCIDLDALTKETP